MTKRTKTDLVANIIDALLLDNDSGEISPEDIRTGFIDTADSVVLGGVDNALTNASDDSGVLAGNLNTIGFTQSRNPINAQFA